MVVIKTARGPVKLHRAYHLAHAELFANDVELRDLPEPDRRNDNLRQEARRNGESEGGSRPVKPKQPEQSSLKILERTA